MEIFIFIVELVHDFHSDKMQLFELHSSEMAVFKTMYIPTGYKVFYLNG